MRVCVDIVRGAVTKHRSPHHWQCVACSLRVAQRLMRPSTFRVRVRQRLAWTLMSTQTVCSCEPACCGKRPDWRLTFRDDHDDALDEEVELEEQGLARKVEIDNGGKVDDDVDEDTDAGRNVDDDLSNDLGNELDLDRVAEIDDGADVDACRDECLDEDCDLVDVDRDVCADVETSCRATIVSYNAEQ